MSGRQILIVEDNEDAARALSILLGMRGHSCEVAHTAAAARAAAAKRSFHVVLLDLTLPDADGSTLVKDLKRLPSVPRVVAVSGQLTDAPQRSLDLGCDAHVSKPIEFDRLLAAMAME